MSSKSKKPESVEPKLANEEAPAAKPVPVVVAKPKRKRQHLTFGR